MGRPGKNIVFEDHHEFTPNVTPVEMFKMGIFGGTYWRPIYSGVVNKNLENQHLEFPNIAKLPRLKLTQKKCDQSQNYFNVKAGSSLNDWESKGWIDEQDPYGWVQWYCRFFYGRRSNDDERQIDRWRKYAGPTGRFKRNLDNQIERKGVDASSSTIKQGLLQWAYVDPRTLKGSNKQTIKKTKQTSKRTQKKQTSPRVKKTQKNKKSNQH